MSNFLRRPDSVGKSIEIAGSNGVLCLRDGEDPVVMLAGRTGLAPMVSMQQPWQNGLHPVSLTRT
jgi:ferredoxin-NADP reductase